MEGVAWLHGAAPEMERRGRGMEIDTDSGLARSALTMWRRCTLHPDHIHTGDTNGEATRMQAVDATMILLLSFAAMQR